MKTAAIIGASSNRAKWGNKALRAFRDQGYEVFPINHAEPEVEGVPTRASVRDLAEKPDVVTVYVPPPVLLKLLPEIAERGCGELWLNPGTASDAVLEKAEALGLNVIEGCSIIGIGASPGGY